MCGIYGISDRAGGISLDAVQSPIRRMHHRGPDGEGMWLSEDGRVALAHRRLAVVDLSDLSRQPMASPDGRCTIVFNGEIYNFRALRQILSEQGWRFTSSGDTEVVLAAYLTWGKDCLSQFNGMFAFVIHDRREADGKGKLFFARDRAGEKPFYYRAQGGVFEFASELKAMHHSGKVNLGALNHYLSLGYVPGDLCLFDGVAKLPPAHCGQWDIARSELKVWPYWSLPANQPEAGAEGQALATEAGELIKDSVRLRLEADVPVGVLLSGGLDSSLVVAAAAAVSSRPVETFTISLPGSALDEAGYAKLVADHFGTHHHVLPLQEASLRQLDELMALVDEPIADSSILPAWLVFGLARQRVTVALGGDGGDELFGGYADYTTSVADAARLATVPGAVTRTLAELASWLPAGVRGRNRMASLKGGPYQQLIWGRPYFDVRLRQRLLHGDALASLGAELDAPERFLLSRFVQGRDPIDQMTRTHFGSILPDDFLVKVDRASMATSLEVRAPMLDHRLIEFAFGKVPSEWKVKGAASRRLQHILAQRWLPPALDVKRKQGFSIPINEWLRQEGEEKLMGRMADLPDCLDMGDIQQLVKGHMAGRANGGRLFALIMLSAALRNARSDRR